jgi:hypothetical protein
VVGDKHLASILARHVAECAPAVEIRLQFVGDVINEGLVEEAIRGVENAAWTSEEPFLGHAHSDGQIGFISSGAQHLLELLPKVIGCVIDDGVELWGQDEVCTNVSLHVSYDALVMYLVDDLSIQSRHNQVLR